MNEQPMKFIVMEGRQPQDGSKPARVKIIFDARLSPVSVCAGVSQRNHKLLSDASMVEEGDWPHPVGRSAMEIEGLEVALQAVNETNVKLCSQLAELAKVLGCRPNLGVMLARAQVLAEDSDTLCKLNEVMKAQEAVLQVLDCLTKPNGSFDSAIHPGTERDALQKAYNELPLERSAAVSFAPTAEEHAAARRYRVWTEAMFVNTSAVAKALAGATCPQDVDDALDKLAVDLGVVKEARASVVPEPKDGCDCVFCRTAVGAATE